MLEGQVIRQDLRQPEVSVEDLRKGDVLRKRDRSAWIDRAKRCGKGVCHARGGIGVGEIGVRNAHDRSKGRNADNVFKRYPIGRLVIVACSTTDAGLAICRQLVGKAHTRADIAQVVIDRGCGASSVMITPAEDQVLRCIGVARRLRSRHKTCDSPLAVRVGEERIPAYTGAHGEPLGCVPVILNEGTPVVAAKVQIQTACLDKAGRISQQKVGEIVSAQIAAECVVAIGLICISHGKVKVFPFAPNLEFMRSLDEGGDFTIGYVAVIPGSRGGLLAYGKLSGYIDVQRCRKIGGLRNIRARRGDIEGRGRFRQSGLPCQSEIAIEKSFGRDRVDVDDADVLQTLFLRIFSHCLQGCYWWAG